MHTSTFDFDTEMLKCGASLKAFAISLTGNVDRAEDLVQETILRALANRHTFEPGTNMPAWLFTILRNFFRSEYRKRKREVEDADGAHAQTLISQPSQQGYVEFGDFAEKLHALPDDQREALILVGASGFSYDEAALISGCAVGTIKSRVNRARERLTLLLSEEPTRAVPADRDPYGVRNTQRQLYNYFPPKRLVAESTSRTPPLALHSEPSTASESKMNEVVASPQPNIPLAVQGKSADIVISGLRFVLQSVRPHDAGRKVSTYSLSV